MVHVRDTSGVPGVSCPTLWPVHNVDEVLLQPLNFRDPIAKLNITAKAVPLAQVQRNIPILYTASRAGEDHMEYLWWSTHNLLTTILKQTTK